MYWLYSIVKYIYSEGYNYIVYIIKKINNKKNDRCTRLYRLDARLFQS